MEAWYGTSVATAGDVNGDGCAEVIVGAPTRQRTGGPGDEGQAFLYYGNGGRGVALRTVQQQMDESPLAHLGLLDHDHDAFFSGLLAKSPFGRGGHLLELEAKPLGVSFDGTDTCRWRHYLYHASGTPSWYSAIGLIPDMPYDWRVRWHYDPATTPWMPASRWMTMPWNGWQEADPACSPLAQLPTASGMGFSVQSPGRVACG